MRQCDYTIVLMRANDNQISAFLHWWWQGLTAPWPGSTARPRLVRATGSGFALDQQGDSPLQPIESLSPTELRKLKRKQDAYLVAPQSDVLRIALPESGLPDSLPDWIESVLPFKHDELHFVPAQSESELFAIAKTSVAPLLTQLHASAIPIQGLSFGDSQHPTLLSVDNGTAQRSKSPSVVSASLALVGAISFAAVLLWLNWQVETRQQIDLATKLDQLSQNTMPASDSAAQDDILAQIRKTSPRSPDAVAEVLQSLTEALPVDMRINQLILNKEELIIDGEAVSASQFQSGLEEHSQFNQPKFVSAISSNAQNDTERFRLRVTLANKTAQPAETREP